MAAVTVDDGAWLEQRSGETRAYTFDWDALNLASGALISSQTITAAAVCPPDAAALTLTNKSILSGNRKSSVEVAGGTVGAKYRITNAITTNESPAQVKVRHFDLSIVAV